MGTIGPLSPRQSIYPKPAVVGSRFGLAETSLVVPIPVGTTAAMGVGLGPSMPWPVLNTSGVQSMRSPAGFALSTFTLPNGHRLIVEQRPTDIISLRTFVKAGSMAETPIHTSPLYRGTRFPSGIAHLDEHCHFLSTEHFQPKNSWTHVVESDGARFNASTTAELIQHELAFNREDLPRMLALHAESVLRPYYNPKDILQEKTNVLNEMGFRMNVPENRIHSKLWELMFDRPDFQTLGNRSDVQETTVAQLGDFHQTFYTPENMVTVVSGRVNPAMVLAMAQKEFGAEPPAVRRAQLPSYRLALPVNAVRSATVKDPQLTHSMVSIAFPAPARTAYKERLAMEVLGALLGDGPLSMLQTDVQNRYRLVNAIESGYIPTQGTGSMEITLHADPGKEQQALAASLQSIARLSMGYVSPQKLAEVKERLANKFQKDVRDVELATHLMGEEASYNSLPYFVNYLPWLAQMTPQDVLETAQKYLNPSRYAVVFGIPDAPLPDPLPAPRRDV